MSSLKKSCYMNTKITPFFDKNNFCTYIASIVSDSTEPIHWQNRLEEREEKFRSTAENTDDLMAIINSDGRIHYVSPSHEKILGYKVDDFEGKDQKHFIHPDDHEYFENKVAKTIKLAKPLHGDVRLLRKNKKAILCRVNGTAVYHKDGSFKHLVIVSQDISKKEAEKEEMKRMAYYDFLTGIPNRRKFSLEFNKALEKWQDKNIEFAFFLLDIDEFKKINDQWGHDIGDTILVEVGKRLSENIHKKDTVARIGGDEFALLVRDIRNNNHIQSIAKSIKNLFNNAWSTLPCKLKVYTSIGASWSGCYEKNTIDNLQKNADIALYKAKKIKGNSIIIH